MNIFVCAFFIIITFPVIVHSWDSLQLEVFDVVEEVQQNFYELLDISQEADISQIKSAYRKLSLVLHPDKNPEEDAAIKFRQLVSVYDVLRHPEKRQYYNEVLVKGLPDWKSAVYYYRKAKKVTLIELSLFLFFVITLGQYIVSWASYFEKKLTLESNRRGKQKKIPIEIEIEKPSVYNTLPFQLPLIFWLIVTYIPRFVLFLCTKLQEYLNSRKEQTETDEKTDEDEGETVRSQPKRKYIQEIPEYSGVETTGLVGKTETKIDDNFKSLKTDPWSEEEMSELSKLIKKFPSGIPGRWELVADAMNRSVDDVTKVMKLLRQNSYKIGASSTSETETTEKQKINSLWTQNQQQAFEKALQDFPKSVIDRWDKIAENVPNKTKEECILRYKYLVEIVKKQKNEVKTT